MKNFFFIAALFTGLVACKSKSGAALKYNQDIVAKDKSIQPEEQMIEDKMNGFYNDGKYDSIAAAGKHMEEVLQKAIDEVDAMPTPAAKGINDFKAAALKYFRFFKNIYTITKEYGLAGNYADRADLMSDRQNQVARIDNAVKELQQAQQIFSGANGFSMK